MPVPKPSNAQAFNQNQQNYPYTKYELRQSFRYNSGSLAIPTSGTLLNGSVTVIPSSRPAQEIVSTSAPYGQRVVAFDLIRRNALPTVPSIDVRANESLAEAEVVTFAPSISTDGSTRTYRIVGQYVYDQLAPVYPTDGLGLGTTDLDAYSPGNFVLGPDSFGQMT